MNHQPYEDWIFKDDLSEDQLLQLQTHLSECEPCRRLAQALQNMEGAFEQSPKEIPASGFPDRWQLYAEKRQKEEVNKKAWGAVSGVITISLLGLYWKYGPYWSSPDTPLLWVVRQLAGLINVLTSISDKITAIRDVLQLLPGNLLTYTVSAGMILAFVWLSIWIAAMRRIFSTQRRVE